MAYCPEDGQKLVFVPSASIDICYDCPDCNTHWQYVNGAYSSVCDYATCDVCDSEIDPFRSILTQS